MRQRAPRAARSPPSPSPPAFAPPACRRWRLDSPQRAPRPPPRTHDAPDTAAHVAIASPACLRMRAAHAPRAPHHPDAPPRAGRRGRHPPQPLAPPLPRAEADSPPPVPGRWRPPTAEEAEFKGQRWPRVAHAWPARPARPARRFRRVAAAVWAVCARCHAPGARSPIWPPRALWSGRPLGRPGGLGAPPARPRAAPGRPPPCPRAERSGRPLPRPHRRPPPPLAPRHGPRYGRYCAAAALGRPTAAEPRASGPDGPARAPQAVRTRRTPFGRVRGA